MCSYRKKRIKSGHNLGFMRFFVQNFLKVLSFLTKVRKKRSHFKKIFGFFDYSD